MDTELPKFKPTTTQAYFDIVTAKYKPSLYQTVEAILSSTSYVEYIKDVEACLEYWQYANPSDIEHENRFKLDREAYLKHYFETAHEHTIPYDEKVLIQRLIKNLAPAKHPIFIAYREWLQSKLRDEMTNINAYTHLKGDTMTDEQFLSFHTLFDKAIEMGAIDPDIVRTLPKANQKAMLSITTQQYYWEFATWLINTMQWDGESETQLATCFTRECFTAFLAYKSQIDKTQAEKMELMKAKWNVKGQGTPTGERKEREGERLPTFTDKYRIQVYGILKDYFSPTDQIKLKTLLETGVIPTRRITFKDNGNRLADVFKKLIENDIIVGISKQDLEKWIQRAFLYTHQNEVKKYSPDYIEKCISRNYYPCKKPILSICAGQIMNT